MELIIPESEPENNSVAQAERLHIFGCFIPVTVSASKIRKSGIALIDTGATSSGIRPDIASQLGLTYTEDRGANSSGVISPGYSEWELDIPEIELLATIPKSFPFQWPEKIIPKCIALIGRDVLQLCKLTYDGDSGTCTLELAKKNKEGAEVP
ncbi:MAG TPA: hypothetical protein VFD13_06985 [Candidatus Kapabacteria bacterium]|nr:hypothetical protein [Candidatus Kapabacteria bacterium]